MPTAHKKPIAVVCADIHLSSTPPIARAVETNWFKTMKQSLDQLRELSDRYGCPIICAGDIFHHWKAPPELINFAMDNMPKMLAIPGQHDMPFHDPEMLEQSAYTTLEKAGILTRLTRWYADRSMVVLGFPYGSQVEVPHDLTRPGPAKDRVLVAVAHEYVWIKDCGHPAAPEECELTKKSLKYDGFSTVICGDNHTPFSIKLKNGALIFNCGALMQRTAQKRPYKLRIGLLHADGNVESVPAIDAQKDIVRCSGDEQDGRDRYDFDDYIRYISKLQTSNINYIESLKHAIASLAEDAHNIKEILYEAIENARKR